MPMLNPGQQYSGSHSLESLRQIRIFRPGTSGNPHNIGYMDKTNTDCFRYPNRIHTDPPCKIHLAHKQYGDSKYGFKSFKEKKVSL